MDKARPFVESLRNGSRRFDFVEVMSCSGGCVGGGGQPIDARSVNAPRLLQLRANAVYQRDASHEIRLSCDNPQIRSIYNEFLGEPQCITTDAVDIRQSDMLHL
ncbi:MAG: iron hydrogenase small subunit [Treponema sp.]|nr:iron hydrogenase small subunit [Treponema sp.]